MMYSQKSSTTVSTDNTGWRIENKPDFSDIYFDLKLASAGLLF